VRATDSLVSKVCSKINNDKITNLAAEQGWKVTQTWPPMLSAHYRPYGSGHAPSIVAHPGVLLALFPPARAIASGTLHRMQRAERPSLRSRGRETCNDEPH
jgi:hypothetical protein